MQNLSTMLLKIMHGHLNIKTLYCVHNCFKRVHYFKLYNVVAHCDWWLLPGEERRCSVVPGGGRDQNWPVVPWTQYQQCSTARPRPGTAWPQHYTPLAQCHQTITTYHLPFTLTTCTTAMKSITHSNEPETKKNQNFQIHFKIHTFMLLSCGAQFNAKQVFMTPLTQHVS